MIEEFLRGVQGKKIVNVYYDKDMENMPVMMLDDGSAIFIQQDDEGNGAGVPVHVSGDKEVGMWQIF
jgi:hypothetical protein